MNIYKIVVLIVIFFKIINFWNVYLKMVVYGDFYFDKRYLK